jgi:hypothetical protein
LFCLTRKDLNYFEYYLEHILWMNLLLNLCGYKYFRNHFNLYVLLDLCCKFSVFFSVFIFFIAARYFFIINSCILSQDLLFILYFLCLIGCHHYKLIQNFECQKNQYIYWIFLFSHLLFIWNPRFNFNYFINCFLEI